MFRSEVRSCRPVGRSVLPLATALVTAVAVSIPVHAAVSRPLRCGDTVRRDTVLTADLTNCRGNGLVIGADGITLDLNGHTISGRPGSFGVLAKGRRDVRITGSGTVRHFGDGVLLQNSTNSQVEQTTVTDNLEAGILVSGGSDDTMFHVTTKNNFEGIALNGGDHHVAASNTVSDTDIDDTGILLSGHATHARILGNTVTGPDFAGIFISPADSSVVEGNRITNASQGIFVFPGSHDVIAYNHISSPKHTTDVGIALSGGTGDVLDHNVVEGTTGDGIALSSFPAKGGETVNSVVRHNVVRAAGQDGFAVKPEGSGPVRHTRLSGNRAERSGDDGFDVRSATTSLRHNVARSNSDYGIVAVRGVTDAGHNRASGNGHRPQCKGVKCS